jgi:hypothetical protein
MPETPEIPEMLPLANAATAPNGVPAIEREGETPETAHAPEIARGNEPMLDVHMPHGGLHTWKDFWIHLGTITLGLLIAISLEQTVEALHHSQQRHQLEEDLRAEAENNQRVIDRDLRMQDIEPWFVHAQMLASATPSVQNKLRFHLPPPPCISGSVGTAKIRYFAPSQAVWTAAQESGLVALLPAPQARLQARLAHNYDLLAGNREAVYEDCQAIVAMRQRLSAPGSAGSDDTWTMTPEQAEKFAATAADTKVAIQALDFRLRWSKVYEQGIAHGESQADTDMMTMDQTRFEDSSNQ